MKQRTLKTNIKTKNIGLHSGKSVSINLLPAPENTGIVFFRTDINKAIKVNANNINQTMLCTTLFGEDFSIKTIEHLLSALAMCQIDNIIIELDSEEVPIFDGSSMPFIYLIKQAGVESQRALRKFIKIKKELVIEEGDKNIKITPSNTFNINYKIDFNHPFIKSTNQNLQLDFFNSDIINNISKARTFGFLKDVEYLQKNNLALGGSINNAIVLDDYKMINSEDLRYDDEFVRHKILDLIGDFYVEGLQVIGDVQAYKSGHFLNNQLMKKVLSNKENYSIETCENCYNQTNIIKNLKEAFNV
tara:strand:- start:19588 stop:20496 length:909 start_codon:yes stop_codon:yes gene_type:complete